MIKVSSWFGDRNGLARFDGYNFKYYQPDPEVPHTLSHKAVDSIFADRQNYLWLVMMRNGINRFNPETERFENYVHDRNDTNSISRNDISSCYVCDSKGNIWIGTLNGLNCYNPETNGFRRYYRSNTSINSLPGNLL